MPADSVYRKSIEALAKERLAIVSSETSVSAIEEKINCGQVEELIFQAEDELALASKMSEWKVKLRLIRSYYFKLTIIWRG
jgi:NADH dehydrogenase (ubiquinone) 1 alpha subcomplex subunit 5